MLLSRSTILRSAHARVRQVRERFHWRSYRALLAEEMRLAWGEAKHRAALEAVKPVEIRLTPEQSAEIERLEELAHWQPITRMGNERCAALRLTAAMIRSAAAAEAEAARKPVARSKIGVPLQSKVHSGFRPRFASEQAPT